MSKLRQFFENLAVKLTKNSHRGTRRAVFSAFALMIALCTVYALVLPAITATANTYALQNSDITQTKLYWTPVNTGVPRLLTSESTVGLGDTLRFELSYGLDIGTLSGDCDTITYHLPDLFTKVTPISNKAVVDNGTVVGHYSVSEDGQVTISFDPAFVTKNASQRVVGNFSFKCTVSDVLNNGEGKTITIGSWSIKLNPPSGGGETTGHSEGPTTPTTAPPTPVSSGLSIFKDYDIVDETNGLVDFTVIVRADKNTDDAPKILEHMASHLIYDSGFSIKKVVLDEDFQVTDILGDASGTVTGLGVEPLNEFTYQFASPMVKDEAYVMTYRARVDELIIGNYRTENTATIQAKINGADVSENVKVGVYFFGSSFVKKSGKQVGDQINWTITVHRKAASDLGGWILSDKLEGLDYTGKAMLSINEGTPVEVDIPYVFPSGTEEADFVFTYSTPYQPKVGQTGVENKAYFKPGDYTGNPIEVTTKVGTLENNPLKKTDLELTVDTSDPEEPLTTIEWDVEIKPTISKLIGVSTNTAGYDWLYDDTLKTGQYLTDAQATALESAVVAEMTRLGFENRGIPIVGNAPYDPDLQKDYTFELKHGDAPTGCYEGFTLHAYKDLDVGQTLHFAYSSTGPTGDLDEVHHYQNQGKVMQSVPGTTGYSVTSQPEAVYRPALTKTDPVPPMGTNKVSDDSLTTHEYYTVDGTLKWDVAVCVPRGITGPVTVTDTLPEGLTFDNLTMKINGKDTAFTVAWDNTTTKTSGTMDLGGGREVAVTRNGRSIEMVLNAATVAKYQVEDVLNFYVSAKVNQKPDYTDEKDAPRYRNEAVMTALTDGEPVIIGEKEQTQKVVVNKYHDVLTKTVQQTEDDKALSRVPYHIEINPEANDLLVGTDKLTLTDTLSAYCQNKELLTIYLNPSSFKIYEYDSAAQDHKGAELAAEDFTYSYSSEYVGGSTKSYVNTLVIHIPDERALVIEYVYLIKAVSGTSLSVSNVVKLEGVVESEVTSGNTYKAEYDAETAQATTEGLTLYKVDSKNYGVTLPGAHFKLYKYNGSAYVEDSNYVTGQNGTTLLSDLDVGYAYKLVETQAPENYLLDTNPYYFMLAGSAVTVKPSDFAGDLLQQGMSIYRPNTSSYVSVEVKKHWKDENGSTATHDGTVQFNLYRKTGTRDPHVYLTADIKRGVDSYHENDKDVPFERQQFMRGDIVDFVITETRYQPKRSDSGVKAITLNVNGVQHEIQPYWDPAQDYDNNATVTYTLTFTIQEDTHISGFIGVIPSDNPRITATVSGTAPSESSSESGSTESTTAKYKITFTAGGSATISDDPFPSEGVESGTVVTLVPPTPPEGKRFTGWKVYDKNNNDITSSKLSGNNLTMPASNVTVTALFEWIPHTVTVWSGMGTATPSSAGKDTSIQIVADAAQGGQEFICWKVVNSSGEPITDDSVVFDNANSATTTFSMPDHDVIVAPVYGEKAVYTIEVTDGTATVSSSGLDPGEVYRGDAVTLNATIPNNKLFDKWVIDEAPSGFTFNVNQANATFTMPDGDVKVHATFKDKPNNLIMNGDFENVEGTITSSTAGFEWTCDSGANNIGSNWKVVDGVLTFDLTGTGSNGNLVAKIDPTYNNNTGVLKANTPYTLFADVDTNKDNLFRVVLKVGNNLNQVITSQDGYIQFTTGSDPSIYSILVTMDKNNKAGTVFSVDNVILVEGTHTTPPVDETTYDVNISNSITNGTVTANPTSAAENKSVTLTVTPDPGYELDTLTVDDDDVTASVTNGTYTFTMPAEDVDVTATFKKTDYTVTVVNGEGSSSTIQIGGTVNVTANDPATGKEFDYWEISGPGTGTFTNAQTTHVPEATFQLNTPGNVTLTAHYKDAEYDITFDPEGSGTALVNDNAVTKAVKDAVVTLVGIPPTGKVIDYWTVTDADDQAVTVTNTNGVYTFTMPAKAVTATPTWKDAPVSEGYTLTVNASCTKNKVASSLAVSPSATMTFTDGSTATLTITMADVYKGSTQTQQDMAGMFTYSTSNGTVVTPTFTHGSGNDIIGTFTLTMTRDETLTVCANHPDADKEITAELSGGTGGDTTTHNVTISDDIDETKGSVTTDKATAAANESVTLTVTPENGYKLKTLTINGTDVAAQVTNNTYTFSMPNEDVEVSATFEQVVEEAWKNIVDRVTLTFYDKDCTQYGITYHSYKPLTAPVIQYVQGVTPASWTGASTVTPTLAETIEGHMKDDYDPTTFGFTAGETTVVDATDYVYKGALPILSSGTYTYRVGGKIGGVEVWSDPYTFTTKPATASDDLSFIWFSDSHYNTKSNSGTELRKVLAAADSLLPDGADMILSGGDFTNIGDHFYYASSSIDGNEDYFATTPFFVASGNHDRKNTNGVAESLVNVNVGSSGGAHNGTGDYYSFNYNGVHVVVLDFSAENSSSADDEMVEWLETDLDNNTSDWTIVMMHKPIYGPVENGKSESIPSARADLAGVFAEYGVDAVLQGHVHMYARSYPITDKNGTKATGYTTTTETTDDFIYDVLQNPGAPIYTVMGIAGATGNRTVASTQPAYLEKYASGQPYSFSAWRIDGDKLYVDAGYADASTGEIVDYYDHFVIDKSGTPTPPTPTTYAIDISDDTHGTVTAKVGGTEVTEAAANAEVTLTISPATGYELDTLTVDDDDVTASVTNGTYTFTMPAEDVDVTATFKKTNYTVTVVNGEGSSSTIQIGGTVNVTANDPATGKEFDYWEISGTGTGVFTNAQTTHVPEATFQLNTPGNVTLTAHYKDAEYDITFDPEGSGTALVNDNAVTKAVKDAVVTLVGIPPTGKVIDHWTVTDADDQAVTVTNTNGVYTFTMPAKAVTATPTWKDAPVGETASIWSTISRTSTENCSLTDGLTTPLSFPKGTEVTFTVKIAEVYDADQKSDAELRGIVPLTANGGAIVAESVVLGTNTGHNYPVTYTYTVTLNEDTVISGAINSKDKGAITVEVVTGGGTGGDTTTHNVNISDDIDETKGSVATDKATAAANESVTLTVTPENGYKLKTLTINGTDVAAQVTNNTYTFSMPNEDVEVSATFEQVVEEAWKNIVDRVTLTFYDKDCTQYGITYHSYKTLTDPVIQYVQGGSTPASWTGASTVTPTLATNLASGSMMKSYDPDTHTFTNGATETQTDYAYKAALPDTLSGTYTYRVGGKIGGVEVWSDPYTFTTNTSSSSTPDLSFIWFSDTQFVANEGAVMASKMGSILNGGKTLLSNNVDMILSGGDFTDDGGLFHYAAAQIDGNEDFFAKYPLFVASGNHDRNASYVTSNLVNVNVGDSSGASNATGDYYSFDYNGVHVVVLDNGNKNDDNLPNGMASWLESDLAANDSNANTQWTLVMMHKPIYACERDDGEDTEADSQSTLGPIFANHQVDAVLQGHVHMYSRTKAINSSGAVTSGYTTANETNNGFTYEMVQNPGDPIYTVIGAGGFAKSLGADKRAPAESQPSYIAHAEKMQDNSFAAWRIEGDKLYVDTCYLDSSGNVQYYEHFGIDKSGTPTPPTPTTYAIDVSDDTHGTVTAKVGGTTVTEAAANAEVTLTIEPATGYVLDTLTVDDDDVTASVTNSTYTFTMPSHAVEISATFKESGGGGGGDVEGNLITNGTFSVSDPNASGFGWKTDLGATISVSNGVASVKNSNGSQKGIYQLINFTPGNSYTLTCDVPTCNSPLYLMIDTVSNNKIAEDVQGIGYSKTFTATAGMDRILFGGSNREFTIDNVVLIDNGPAGSGDDDDQVEHIVNGNFADSSGWDVSEVIWETNKVQLNKWKPLSYISQDISVVADETYTITIAYNNTDSLAAIVRIGGQQIGTLPKGSGTFTETYTATATGTIPIRIAYEASSNALCDITSVSVMGPPTPDASPSFDAAPFEDAGPGDDDLPSLDLDGARSDLLGDGTGDELIGTYTITASNSWVYLIENLLSEEIINGEPVYYVYYVREVNPSADTITVEYSENNEDGINSGTIDIINTVSEEERETIVLPETGGGGNWPYVVSGVTLMAVCLFGGVVMTRRRRRASG